MRYKYSQLQKIYIKVKGRMGVRLNMSALVGDPDLYPQVFHKMAYLDLCRFQPPGDSEP